MKGAMAFLMISSALSAQIVPYSPLAWIDHTDGVSVEALGRGGASIAIADDVAGVWANPAGIAALKQPEAVFGLEGIRTRINAREEAWSRNIPNGLPWGRYFTQGDRAEGELYSLGYAAGVKPFKIGERAFVFWAGYRPAIEFPDMERTWSENHQTIDGSGQILEEGSMPFRSSASFSGSPMDWGGAVAAQLSSRWSAGIHLHYLQADVTERWRETWQGLWAGENATDLKYEFAGLLWDAGLQFDAGRGFRLGAVYRSGMRVGMDYRIDQDWGGVPPEPIVEHAHVRWPDGWGLGAAWEASPSLRVALDLSHTNWSDAGIDHFISGTSYVEWTDAGFPTFYFDQKDATNWRLGAEYRMPAGAGPAWIFRAGCFRTEQNVLAPFIHFGFFEVDQVVEKGITLGASLAWKRVKIDAAFIHQSGTFDEHQMTDDEGHPWGGAYKIAQDRLLVSVTAWLGDYGSRGGTTENAN